MSGQENSLALGGEDSGAQDARTIVVISDLHIGAGTLDDFDVAIELELVAFLTVLSKSSTQIELVINGDFLNFVQSDPWNDPDLRAPSVDHHFLCFSQSQSMSKLDSILDGHPNVFTALGNFLRENTAHRLVLLPGNHDPDLFWPDIRSALRTVLERSARSPLGDRLRFHLEEVYRPPWAPSVWIEHGHQHDPCNNFFFGDKSFWSTASSPIFVDSLGEERLMECVGTRFLNKYLNHLDDAYPFVDNVKPFSRFLKSFGVSALAPGYGPVTAAAAVWGMLKYIASTVKKSTGDLLGIQTRVPPSAAAVVAAGWELLSQAEREVFIARLRSKGIRVDASLPILLADQRSAELILDALADDLQLASALPQPSSALLGIGGGGATLTLAGGYIADESAELIRAARRALRDAGASAVIMGHTHEPKDHPHGLSYVNTGSWTRYLKIEPGDQKSSWSLLKRNAAAHFPFNLLYAEINPLKSSVVRLKTWSCSDGL